MRQACTEFATRAFRGPKCAASIRVQNQFRIIPDIHRPFPQALPRFCRASDYRGDECFRPEAYDANAKGLVGERRWTRQLAAQDSSPASISTIGEELTITGNVTSKGELHVNGRVQGDVHCAALVLGQNAQVEGSVVAQDVMVRGRLIGSVRALRVVLQSTAYVEGNLLHKSLSLEQGTHFEGESRPSDDPLSIPEIHAARPQQDHNGPEVVKQCERANGSTVPSASLCNAKEVASALTRTARPAATEGRGSASAGWHCVPLVCPDRRCDGGDRRESLGFVGSPGRIRTSDPAVNRRCVNGRIASHAAASSG